MENPPKPLYCPSASPYLWTDELKKDERTIFKARCKRWDCPYCAEVNRFQHWIRMKRGIDGLLNKGHVIDFITITSHEKLRTAEATYNVWKSAWTKLSTRYRRAYAEAHELSPEFVYLLECHKDGRLHVHGLFSGHIKTRWWKDNCRQCGLGYQAKSVEMDGSLRAINYISKYVSKQMGVDFCIKRFRRINYSRGFDTPDDSESGIAWNILDKKDSIVSLIEQGWALDLNVTLHGQLIEEIINE